jgi:hypothetical protein
MVLGGSDGTVSADDRDPTASGNDVAVEEGEPLDPHRIDRPETVGIDDQRRDR